MTMNRKTNLIWLAGELGGMVAFFTIVTLVDRKYDGLMVLVVALGSAIGLLVIGLMSNHRTDPERARRHR
jgi:hypothetical protein